MTVIHNCEQTSESIKLGRTMPALPLEQEGVLFVGHQLFEEELFTVSVC